MATMNNPVRRFLWLLLLAAAGAAAWTWWRRDRGADDAPNETPTWPPLAEPTTTEPTSTEPTGTKLAADEPGADEPETAPATWRPPNEDGSCPQGYPVKANDNSGIFHVPSGRFYERTKAERCYTTVEAALADGYRQAKS